MMTRDLIEPKASLERHPGRRDAATDDSYRTRTPSNTRKTGFRSASPSPYVKANGYTFKGASYTAPSDTMAKPHSDSDRSDRPQGNAYKKPTHREGGKGRKPLTERSGNADAADVFARHHTSNGACDGAQQLVADPSFRPYSGMYLASS